MKRGFGYVSKARFVAIALCISAGLMVDFSAGAAQPNIEKAFELLTSARRSLIEATPDKGGHRAKAIKLVDDAISEVQAGIEVHQIAGPIRDFSTNTRRLL